MPKDMDKSYLSHLLSTHKTSRASYLGYKLFSNHVWAPIVCDLDVRTTTIKESLTNTNHITVVNLACF